MIIAGDINYPKIDWSAVSAPTPSDGGHFIDIVNDFYLQQLVTTPTRICNTTSSLLDLVLTSNPTRISNLAVGGELSDHCMVKLDLLLSPVVCESKPRKIFLYSKGNYDQIRLHIRRFSAMFFESTPLACSVDENWLKLKDAITTSVDKNIPHRFTTTRNRRPPWLTPSLRQKIRKRDRLAGLATKSKSPIDRGRYRKVRNEVTQEIRRQYQSHLNAVIGDAKTNPRNFYRFIKSRRTDPIGVPPLKSGDTVISDDGAKAECLGDYFRSVFTVENTDPFPNTWRSHSTMPDIEVTQPGVYNLLSKIDVSKSTGPDELSPRIIKELKDEIAAVLTFLFNQSLSSGVVPSDWRIANIFALHKKGAKDQPENYRPISLTSICSKVLEHIVYSSISRYLDENNILTPRQHGFRPGHSCESQLILAVDDWAKSLDTGHRTDIAIFDFSKAFDSVPHRRLLSKIASYGIGGSTLRWISSFLTDRHQRVVVGGCGSLWSPVISGVPQGTVLGPLLFLLYINDITDNLDSNIRLFADDCILYREIASDADTDKLQADIDKLYSWSNTWQMSFNSKKCHVLSVSRKRQSPFLDYRLGNEPLTVVDSYPYLGVTVSSDLRWHRHVDNICVKATSILNLVRRNIYQCSEEVKALAYLSLVRPHLEYAAAAWDPYTAHDSDQLEKVQRRAARFVKNDYRRTSSVTEFIMDLNWERLSDRRKNTRLAVFFKALHQQIAIPVDHLQRPTRCTRRSGAGSFIAISSNIDSYKFSFYPRTVVDWNSLPEPVRLKSSLGSFRGALHSV